MLMSVNNLDSVRKIIERAKKGDKSAFSETYSTYFKSLYCYVFLKIGNKAESDDLIQDIFIEFYNSSEDFTLIKTSPLIYLYSIARNSVIDWKRKRRKAMLPHEADENYFDAGRDYEGESAGKEEFDNLRKALKRISDDEQDLIIFKFINGLSSEEIAIILEKDKEAVQRIQSRGFILLKNILKNEISDDLDLRKEKIIERAFKMREEGKRLAYIFGKFPEYESEIREVFGTVAFIKENESNIAAPKNIFKTILSKLPDKLPLIQNYSTIANKKETNRKVYSLPEINDLPSNKKESESRNDLPYGKLKIALLIVIISVIWLVFFLKRDSKTGESDSQNSSEKIVETI